MKVAKIVANHSHGEGRSCIEASENESVRSDILETKWSISSPEAM